MCNPKPASRIVITVGEEDDEEEEGEEEEKQRKKGRKEGGRGRGRGGNLRVKNSTSSRGGFAHIH